MKILSKITLLFIFLFSANALLCAQTGADSEKGIEAYNQGQYQQAVDILQKAIEANQKDRISRFYLGMSYAQLKNETEAVKVFQLAEKIDGPVEQADAGLTPLKITSKPRVSYTDEAREKQTQGIVKLAIEFGADGQIKMIVPVQSLPNGLTRSTIKAARKIKFTPAAKNGKPYSTIKIVSYQFAIY